MYRRKKYSKILIKDTRKLRIIEQGNYVQKYIEKKMNYINSLKIEVFIARVRSYVLKNYSFVITITILYSTHIDITSRYTRLEYKIDNIIDY